MAMWPRISTKIQAWLDYPFRAWIKYTPAGLGLNRVVGAHIY